MTLDFMRKVNVVSMDTEVNLNYPLKLFYKFHIPTYNLELSKSQKIH